MQNIATTERLGLKGHITIRRHPAGSIEKFQQLIKAGRTEEYLELLNHGEVAAEQDNTIMQGSGTGLDIIGQWLGYQYVQANGGTPVPVGINYGAIGTGNTAPTVSDTQLTTEFARSLISFYQNTAFTTAVLQFFFSDAQLNNQTYNEVGIFANATATANSGNIFNHALIGGGFAKTAGTDTTVQVSITL